MALGIFCTILWKWRAKRAIDVKAIILVVLAVSIGYDISWLAVSKNDWMDNYGPEATLVWKRLKMTHQVLFYMSIGIAALKVRNGIMQLLTFCLVCCAEPLQNREFEEEPLLEKTGTEMGRSADKKQMSSVSNNHNYDAVKGELYSQQGSTANNRMFNR